MSLPSYPEYKDTGLDWAVKLPAHWGTASLKWLSRRYSGGTPDKNRLEYWEEGTIPWLNSGAVNDGRIYEASAYITQEAFENSSAKWIPPGALLIALAGQGRTKGMVAHLMFESTCNQSMAAIVPTAKIDARCLYWWLVCNYQNIRNMAGGDLRDGLNLELLGTIPCPLPPLEEQTAIATFLDRETDKIDALIAEQEKLLTLLAEKRQATISHAVTKGLNPAVPMKDSGLAWLGEVPEHWEVLAFRRKIKSLEQGWSPNAAAEPCADGGWGVLKISAVKAGRFVEQENKELLAGTELDVSICIRPGDLLITRANTPELVGDCCVVPPNTNCQLMLSDLIYRIRLETDCHSSFISHFLRSDFGRTQVRSDARGSSMTMAKISQGHILAWSIPLPPFEEQSGIVSFLESEEERLDALKTETEHAIALLKERRSALIAAAVTGQIDVRQA